MRTISHRNRDSVALCPDCRRGEVVLPRDVLRLVARTLQPRGVRGDRPRDLGSGTTGLTRGKLLEVLVRAASLGIGNQLPSDRGQRVEHVELRDLVVRIEDVVVEVLNERIDKRGASIGVNGVAAARRFHARRLYRGLAAGLAFSVSCWAASEAEGTELRDFIKRKRSHGDPGIEPLDAKEERRFEKLVGKAAEDEGLFARKRREREEQEKIAAVNEELRIAALPRRLEYAEPGSIALPRHVFDWLQNPATGSLDLPMLGALAGLLFSFENQKPILYAAVFEERDGELVLVCSEPFDRLRFLHAVNPNDGRDDFGTSGRVKAQPTLRYLMENKWLAAAPDGGKFTIRLGERARRLREGTEAAKTAA